MKKLDFEKLHKKYFTTLRNPFYRWCKNHPIYGQGKGVDRPNVFWLGWLNDNFKERDLYDFFDFQKKYLTVCHDYSGIKNKWYFIEKESHARSKFNYSSRIKAERDMFLYGFASLEAKLLKIEAERSAKKIK